MVKFIEEPRLIGRLILEGMITKASEFGFLRLPEREKERIILCNENYIIVRQTVMYSYINAMIYGVTYLLALPSKILKFYTIIDIEYLFRLREGEPLSPRDIVNLYGSNTLKEARVIQRDFVIINGRYSCLI